VCVNVLHFLLTLPYRFSILHSTHTHTTHAAALQNLQTELSSVLKQRKTRAESELHAAQLAVKTASVAIDEFNANAALLLAPIAASSSSSSSSSPPQ
jgi:hypothetical protein